MPRKKTRSSKFTVYSRKRGAFDRFTCSQVSSDGNKVLNQKPLDEDDSRPREEIIAEQKKARARLKHDYRVYRWTKEMEYIKVDDESQFKS